MIGHNRRFPNFLRFGAAALFLVGSCAAPAEKNPQTAALPCPDKPEAPKSAMDVDVPPPTDAVGLAQLITSETKVPLQGYRVDARPGDYLLTHDGLVAVVSRYGSLVDYGRENGFDGLVGIESNLQIGLGTAATKVIQIDAVGEKKNIVRVVQRIEGKGIYLFTFTFFGVDGALWVESVAAASPNIEPIEPGPDGVARKLPAMAVTLGERVSWGNVPSWMEGRGLVKEAASARTQFLARDSLGIAYALCSAEGPLLAGFGAPEPGFFAAALTGERVVPILRAGTSERRRIAMTMSELSSGDAVLGLPCVRKGEMRKVDIPTFAAKNAYVEIARCNPTGTRKNYVRITNEQERFHEKKRTIEIPARCFEARLTAPGYAPGAWVGIEQLFDAPNHLPIAGKLHVRTTEASKPIAARLLVRGRDGTADPDWGDEPNQGAALNVAYLERGEGTVSLPPGKYHIAITHGFEYSADEKDIEVLPDHTVDHHASLDHVVDTTGFLSADCHLHAQPSPDAPTPLDERVRSLVAAGVEIAVATDHNRVTDYRPAIQSMGLDGRIVSVVGDEVTTADPGWGHFNVFPMISGASPLAWKGMTPNEIFAAGRQQQPFGAKTLIQVNHPRWGNIGYFDVLRWDSDDLRTFLARAPLADMGFDLLEVFGGDYSGNIPEVEAIMKDWFALLNAGFHVIATGNSDSHKASYHEAGVPRNMIYVGTDDPKALTEDKLVQALRNGNVSVSSGPFVRIEASGKTMGETIAAGETDITVRVDAAPWVQIDRVDIVKNGYGIRSIAMPKKGPLTERLHETLVKGDWIMAIARGSKPMVAYVPRAMPYGFTNPIFVL